MAKFKPKKKPYLAGEIELQKKLDMLKNSCQTHINTMKTLSYSGNELLSISKQLYRTSLRKIFTERFDKGKKLNKLVFKEFMEYRIIKNYGGTIFFDTLVEFIEKEYNEEIQEIRNKNISQILLNND